MSCSSRAAVFLGVIAACLWSVQSQVPQFGQMYDGDVSASDWQQSIVCLSQSIRVWYVAND